MHPVCYLSSGQALCPSSDVSNNLTQSGQRAKQSVCGQKQLKQLDTSAGQVWFPPTSSSTLSHTPKQHPQVMRKIYKTPLQQISTCKLSDIIGRVLFPQNGMELRRLRRLWAIRNPADLWPLLAESGVASGAKRRVISIVFVGRLGVAERICRCQKDEKNCRKLKAVGFQRHVFPSPRGLEFYSRLGRVSCSRSKLRNSSVPLLQLRGPAVRPFPQQKTMC